MLKESGKEFIGSEEPYQTLEAEISELGQKAAELEETAQTARRAGKKAEAEDIEERRAAVLAEQREKLRKVAHLKKAPL